MVKIWCFHCWGPRFNPCLGNQDPISFAGSAEKKRNAEFHTLPQTWGWSPTIWFKEPFTWFSHTSVWKPLLSSYGPQVWSWPSSISVIYRLVKKITISGLPRWFSGKSILLPVREKRRCGFDPWVRKIPWRRKWQPTPVFLPGKSHGQWSLAGYSAWGHKESDTTITRRKKISGPTPDLLDQNLHFQEILGLSAGILKFKERCSTICSPVSLDYL